MPRITTFTLALVCSASAIAQTPSLPDQIRVLKADVESIESKFRIDLAEQSRERLRKQYEGKLTELDESDFDSMSEDDQVDYVLLASEIRYRMRRLDREQRGDKKAAHLLAPVRPVIELLQQYVLMQPIEPKGVAKMLSAVNKELHTRTDRLRSSAATVSKRTSEAQRIEALWAVNRLLALKTDLDEFHRFRNGYDPIYSWWCREPVDAVSKSLAAYSTAIREVVVGVPESDKETIIGLPIGESGLATDLAHEFIAYSPDELIAIAEREFDWCHREMVSAARDMGLGEDWRAALEKTKEDSVEPGQQPELIRMLAEEATQFVEQRQLVTVPELCKESWRMVMMTPERQRVNPYFTGGPVISISYPTDTMTFDEKMMSMRGNNPHFARATVHHELIPGHHLQLFMMERYRPYRRLFLTPFWLEGWALYWEMRFWDMDFAKSPENRMGMLFWRKHRAARIIFSLGFHTGKMSPEQCVDYLVDNVGHERRNATAEVRRSVIGGYSPLYQAAYMLGGLQLLQLHREVVGTGKMTERAFHDMFLQQNAIPIELIRARMLNLPLTRDYKAKWRFAAGAND